MGVGPVKECARCGEVYGASQFNEGGVWCRSCREDIRREEANRSDEGGEE